MGITPDRESTRSGKKKPETKSLAPWIQTNLTIRYLGGLGLVAILMITSEMYVQNILKWNEHNYEISTATYNRIQTTQALFHGINKLKEASSAIEITNEKKVLLGLDATLDETDPDQRRLKIALQRITAQINPSKGISGSAQGELQDLMLEIQANSMKLTEFLRDTRMQSNRRLAHMKHVEHIVFFLILFTLTLEAVLVFRPAVKNLSRAVARLENTQLELSRAKAKAEQAVGIRSEFIGRMSHEIRNPMNTVLGMAELLEDTHLSIEQRTYLQVMKRSGKSLLDFMNDILDFSKLGAGEIEITRGEVNLLLLIETVSDLISPQAYERGIEFILDVDPAIPRRIWADRRRIQQILINLLQNALKFTDRGYICLKVSYTPQSERLVFEVSDTGIGITKKAQEKIFESFYQVSSGRRRKAGGAGLGLSISKMLIEKMGGSIGIESEPGLGSKFFFDLRPEFSTFADYSDQTTNRRSVLVRLSSHRLSDPVVRYLRSIASVSTEFNAAQPFDLILTDDIELASKHRDRSIIAIPIAGADDDIRKVKALGLQMTFLPIKPSELEEFLRGETRHDNQERAKAQLILESQQPTRPLRGRVLIVDDSLDNHLVLKAFVSKEKLEIDSAYNGQEALDWVRAGNRYDLILMDVQMPVLDGYEATRLIRQLERDNQTQPTPIVIVTALDDEAERELAQLSGCTDRLVKPVSQSSLLAVVRRCLKTNVANNVIRMNDKLRPGGSMAGLKDVHVDLRKLIPGYVTNRTKELEQMLKWEIEREYERIQASAHKIRGNAATYGFERLGELAASLEDSCKKKNYGPVADLLVEMKTELDRTGTDLQNELNGLA